MQRQATIAYAVLLLASACATTPQPSLPRYTPPAQGSPAAELFTRWDVATTTIGHSFSGGDAFIATVDGAETPSGASSIRVTPGVHRVAVNCLFRSWVVASSPKHTVVSGSFVSGQKYYARCALENDQPRAWLADSPEGLALPLGFNSSG